MSDKLKRVFLEGRYMVLQERIQINPKTLKKIECLKNWHQRRTIREIGNFSLSIQLLYSWGGKVDRDLPIPTVISVISVISAISTKFY